MQNRVLRSIFRERATTGIADSLFAHSPTVTDSSSGSPSNDNVVTAVTTQILAAQLDLVGNARAGNVLDGLAQSGPKTNVSSGDPRLPSIFDTLAKNLDQLRAVTEEQGSALIANTAAVTSNTARSVGQSLTSAGKVAGGLLGGLTALPLISDVLKLFGFGGTNATEASPATTYRATNPVAFDQTISSNQAGSSQDTRYDQFGMVRASLPDQDTFPQYYQGLNALVTSTVQPASTTNSSGNLPNYLGPQAQSPGLAGINTTTQVTVNISAMDSRSFLDRSQDIAQAVREAMLNMHPINDVVNDL